MQPGFYHRGIDRLDTGERFRILRGDNLDDILHGMFGIAGVYPFWAIGQLDLASRFQSAASSKGRTADFFGHTGVDGAFQDHHRTVREIGDNGGTGVQDRV